MVRSLDLRRKWGHCLQALLFFVWLRPLWGPRRMLHGGIVGLEKGQPSKA